MWLRIKILALISVAISATVVIAASKSDVPKSASADNKANASAVAQSDVLAVEVNEVNFPPFPYVAEITGNDVFVRSGAGTEYYVCGKLNKSDRVTVVTHKTVWSGIVPPAGSFSLISVQHIRVDPNNPAIGIVVEGTARVYAGSDFVEPIRSETLQAKLNSGDTVRLLGEQKDDYYKIVPPSGAYLWVATQYAKPLGQIGRIPLTVQPSATAEPEAVTDSNTVYKPEPEAEAVITSDAAKRIEDYQLLEKQFKQERTKPIDQQNYESIKKSLLEIANDKQAGRAARYAQFSLNQIKRCELALEVAKAVQFQDEQLQQAKDQIANARQTKLSEIPNLGNFAVIGQLQLSTVYTAETDLKRYRIVGESGKTVCYAVPDDTAKQIDLSKFVDKRVGLVGKIEPHPQTTSVLVRFTEIAELK